MGALIEGVGIVQDEERTHATSGQQGQYNFSSYERIVSMLAARGMRPLFILDYTNSLYESSHSPAYTSVGPHTDAVRQAFARFAAAAAAKFKGRGIVWEIWN